MGKSGCQAESAAEEVELTVLQNEGGSMAFCSIAMVGDAVVQHIVGPDFLTATSAAVGRTGLLGFRPLRDLAGHGFAGDATVLNLLTAINEDLQTTGLVTQAHSRVGRVLVLAAFAMAFLERLLQIGFPHLGGLDKTQKRDDHSGIGGVAAAAPLVAGNALDAMAAGFGFKQVGRTLVGNGKRPL